MQSYRLRKLSIEEQRYSAYYSISDQIYEKGSYTYMYPVKDM